MDIFLFVVVSFLFGFTTDFADLLDEHGLKWFQFSDIIFGALWGFCGAYIILTNVTAGIFVVALVLYWLFRGKLDYPNHVVAGVIISLSVIWSFSHHGVPVTYVFVPFVVCLLSERFGSYIRNRYPLQGNSRSFVLIRHAISPISLSILLGDLYPIYFSVLSMVGSRISDGWFNDFLKNGHSRLTKTLGMSLKEGAHN